MDTPSSISNLLTMDNLLSSLELLLLLVAFTCIDAVVFFFSSKMLHFHIGFPRSVLVGLTTFSILLFLIIYLYYGNIVIHDDIMGGIFVAAVILSQALVSRLVAVSKDKEKLPWAKTLVLSVIQFGFLFLAGLCLTAMQG